MSGARGGNGQAGPEAIRAAGALLWRPGPDGQPEFAVLHRPHRQDWTWPKGKQEPGERPAAAAVREVEEETGCTVSLGRPLPTRRYVSLGVPKRVRYWVARADPARQRPFVPGPEVDELLWLPAEAARAQLTYPGDAQLLDSFARDVVDTVPLLVVRHAKAVKRAQWDGPDGERPLEDRGKAQARRLVPLLAAYGVTALVSSDTRRCRDTVLPYAATRPGPGLEVEDEPLLSEEGHHRSRRASRARAAALLGDPRALAVCSHRPVLPDLVGALLPPGMSRDLRPLAPGAFLVVHRDLTGRKPRVVAVERHRS